MPALWAGPCRPEMVTVACVADVEVSLCHPWSALSENSPRTFIFSNNRGYLYVSIYDVLSFLTSQKDKKKIHDQQTYQCSGADSCRDLTSVGNHTHSLQWHQRCSVWVPTDVVYSFCILPSLPLKLQRAFVPNSSNPYRRLPSGCCGHFACGQRLRCPLAAQGRFLCLRSGQL